MYMTITQNDNAYICYVFNASLSWPCLNRINYQFLQRIVRSCLHVFSSQSQSGQTSLNQGNRDHQTVSCLVLTNNILVFCPSCALLQADLQRPIGTVLTPTLSRPLFVRVLRAVWAALLWLPSRVGPAPWLT